MSFTAVEREMDAAVQRRVFPGAILLVRQGARVFYHRAFGCRSSEPESAPMREDTIFDLGSLTKPLATSVAIMLLVKEGKLRVDDRVTRFLYLCRPDPPARPFQSRPGAAQQSKTELVGCLAR